MDDHSMVRRCGPDRLDEHRLSMRGEPCSECCVGRSQETGRIADLVCKQLSVCDPRRWRAEQCQRRRHDGQRV